MKFSAGTSQNTEMPSPVDPNSPIACWENSTSRSIFSRLWRSVTEYCSIGYTFGRMSSSLASPGNARIKLRTRS